MFDPTKPFLRGELGQDQKEDSKENPKTDIQASSSSSKPITVLKLMSIGDIPLLQQQNHVFDLQDRPSHKKSEDSITMVERGEHPNTEEPMNTQELLNTMVASQIQLREDINLIVQQFQNLKGG